jgi:membrane-associated HD superfamily phosphohydrolase
MKNKLILSLVLGLTPLMYNTHSYASASNDPYAGEKGQATDAERKAAIKQITDRLEAVKGIESAMYERLRARLTDDYKINPVKDAVAIESITNYIKQSDVVTGFNQTLAQMQDMTNRYITNLNNITLEKLSKTDIAQFQRELNPVITNLENHAQSLIAAGRANLDSYVEKGLQQERGAYCPKEALGKEAWVALVKPGGTYMKADVQYRLKQGEEQNLPKALTSWSKLYYAPLSTEKYDWKTSTLYCGYTYNPLYGGTYTVTIQAIK